MGRDGMGSDGGNITSGHDSWIHEYLIVSRVRYIIDPSKRECISDTYSVPMYVHTATGNQQTATGNPKPSLHSTISALISKGWEAHLFSRRLISGPEAFDELS